MSFPRYETYRDSGVEWLGEVPSHWDIKPLKAVASFNDDALGEGTPADNEIEYVDISGVDAIRGIVQIDTMPFAQAPSRARRRAIDGDVLISTVRTYLRAIAPVSQPPHNLVVSTGFAVIRPRTANTHFLGYAVRSETFIAHVISRSTGVSYPAINASELVCIKFPVPPAEDQLTIADFLDSETAKIDALVDEQRRLIELLNEKRQAVISNAVTKGLDPSVPMKPSGIEWLGDIPAHWSVSRIATLYCEVAEPGNDDLPVLSVSIHDGVSDDELSPEQMDRKVSRSEDRSKYKAVRPNDLVYNMMRAWQGGFGTVKVEGAVSPAYVVARPKDKLAVLIHRSCVNERRV